MLRPMAACIKMFLVNYYAYQSLRIAYLWCNAFVDLVAERIGFITRLAAVRNKADDFAANPRTIVPDYGDCNPFWVGRLCGGDWQGFRRASLLG